MLATRSSKIAQGCSVRLFSAAANYFPNVQSKQLTVEKAASQKPLTPNQDLVFGHTFTDHMLEVDWFKNKGWTAPRILPFQNLSMHPASSSLHYGLECFEGMKAYLDTNNKIRLFRPDKNMERLNSSLERFNMPNVDGNEYIKCMMELIRLDKRWIPSENGYSLYIRPTAISTSPFLGVGAAESIKVYTILCPVGPYYREGFNPVRLYANPRNIRAWPGGVGNIKCGGNYAMSIKAQTEANAKGYAQVMWLFGNEHYVTEVGTMNQFFFWVRRDGKRELITAPLDGTILPGVTRDSILQLAREWNEFEVSERAYTIHEVIEAIKEGRLIEAFGAGTAAVVSPVKGFHFDGVDYDVPLVKGDPNARIGVLSQRFAKTIMDIQYGRIPHKWSVIVD